MKLFWLPRVCLAGCALSFAPILKAADLISAQELLDRVEKARGSAVAKTNVVDPALATFRTDLTNFIQKRAEMPAAESAQRWVEFVERMTKAEAKTPKERVSFSELLQALPEPAAWPELERIVSARPLETAEDLALSTISLRLVNQTDKAALKIDDFIKKAKDEDRYSVEALRMSINRNKSQTADSLRKQLDRMAAASGRGEMDDGELPKLTPTLTEAEAEAALKAVLPKFKMPVHTDYDDDGDYVWKAALAVVDQLPIAQWGLVNSYKAAPLFEAMEKRFAKETAAKEDDEDAEPSGRFSGGGNGIREARDHYILGLIKQYEIKKAVELARKFKADAPAGVGYGPREVQISASIWTDFYLEGLKQDAKLPWWDSLIQSAAQSNRAGEALALAEDALKKAGLKPEEIEALRGAIGRIKLADDRVDEALEDLRAVTKDRSREHVFLLLGAALKRPELMREVAARAQKKIEAIDPQMDLHGFGRPGNWMEPSGFTSLILAANGLAGDALELSAKELQTKGSLTLLQSLGTIYIREGRPADALLLLEKSPEWGIEDVAQALQGNTPMNHGYTVLPLPIPLMAALGLAASGREREALTVLKAFLQVDAGNDRAYELLLELEGDKAMATLEAIFALDRFEERPLIWKAVLQQRAGNLEAAEKTAREAIAIDPSDGEEGPGDRLRAYAVLAEIRAARGDEKQADFLRNAVKAIRLSEEADLDYAAGLLKRAIGKYSESLKLFSDAYCVQARIAIQMAALGLTEQAEEHYQRAFELMPDSFGRVESHCFGCEGAFEGERARDIAGKTFAKLVQKTPEKPQLHYLLGYLRNQEGKPAEAASHLRQAVKLDPLYLNAWKLLGSISEQVKLTTAEEDEVALNMMRLDPSGRHGGGVESVNDLAKLWAVARELGPNVPEKPTKLFRLAASAEALVKQRAGPTGRYLRDFNEYSYRGAGARLTKNPASAIVSDPIISAAAQTFGLRRGMGDY